MRIGIVNADGTLDVHDEGYSLAREDMSARTQIDIPDDWSDDPMLTAVAWDQDARAFSAELAAMMKRALS